MGKKVAVCLCGEPRNIEYASRCIKEVFKKINVDYFCHVWTENTVEIPENCKQRLTKTDIIESSFADDTEGLKQYVTEIYNPRDIVVEKCDVERRYGQFVTAEKCVNLTKQYKEDYDIVLKMRFDTPIMWTHAEKSIHDDVKLFPDRVFVNNIRMCCGKNYYIEISDHGPFFGSRDVMYSYFNNMHEKVEKYIKNYEDHAQSGKFDSEPHKMLYENYTPEYIWFILFGMQNIKPVKYQSMYHALSRPGIPFTEKIPATHKEQQQYVTRTENYSRWRDYSKYSRMYSDRTVEDYRPDLNYDTILNQYLSNIRK